MSTRVVRGALVCTTWSSTLSARARCGATTMATQAIASISTKENSRTDPLALFFLYMTLHLSALLPKLVALASS